MTMTVRHYHRDVVTRMLDILTAERVVSMSRLALALYGQDTPQARRAVTTTMGRLRRAGYEIACPFRGTYALEASPAARDIVVKARTPEHTLKLALARGGAHPVCDCGQPATHVARFWQLDPACKERFLNALIVCEACAWAFDEAEDILAMADAKAIAAHDYGDTSDNETVILAAYAEHGSLSVPECARRTGLSEEYVRQYVRKSGKFVAIPRGPGRKRAIGWQLRENALD